MKKQVLFIHGGGEGAHEEDRKMAASLREALGTAYNVLCPKISLHGLTGRYGDHRSDAIA